MLKFAWKRDEAQRARREEEEEEAEQEEDTVEFGEEEEEEENEDLAQMEGEDYRDSEVEADSDHEDQEEGEDLDHLHPDSSYPLHFHTDLDSSETGTVRRRAKTIVTPKMAMESFRLSFLNDDQDVNFDTILGELSELEKQLNSTQTQLFQSMGGRPGGGGPPGGSQVAGAPCGTAEGGGVGFLGSDTIQAELDALAAEITSGLGYNKSSTTNGQLLLPPMTCEHISDAGETDSAFSDNASLPSSESYTSMATVSSSAETTSSSSGETCSITSAMSSTTVMNEEEQLQRLKAEKIRIALEKIKEAKIRKLFVRAFAKDGSSKSILVDEKMTVGQVCSMLADKHHGKLTHAMTVIEHMPELFMERILEDHDSLVENMVMWTRDSKNKVLFEERHEKYNLFFQPEKYLLSGSSSLQRELGATQKERLIQEFFSPAGVSVPEVEGALYLKSDGKKAWKKYFFVLRASGLYYNPKGKVSKAPKDLVCLVQFEFVEVYRGIGWKKKYHSPTDFCFALKHPQIQKKTSKYIRYFCAESDPALDQWIMGIRIAKLGKQLLHNFEHVHHEIATWDLRQPTATPIVDNPSVPASSGSGATRLQTSQDLAEPYPALNPATLQDSRLSVLEGSPQHTIVTVQHNNNNNNNAAAGSSQGSGVNEGVVGGELTPGHQRKGSEGGESCSGGGHKTPTKRVSFSTTHSIITDSCEQLVAAKHRDSIVSASTDSSEESNSSGEGRLTMANTLRGKMRPKLPVTTETTRLLTGMNQLSFDGDGPGRDGSAYDETSSLSSASSTSSSRHTFSRSDRRRSSMTERRSSDGRIPTIRTNGVSGGTPMSPKVSARRASHEGSPGPMSPSMRHSGTQQWVDDYYQDGRGQRGGVEDVDDVYSGVLSHYEQIPAQVQQSYQQHFQQQQYQQQQQQEYQELQYQQLQQYHQKLQDQEQQEYQKQLQQYQEKVQQYEQQRLLYQQQQQTQADEPAPPALPPQQPQQQQPDLSELYATITHKASRTTTTTSTTSSHPAPETVSNNPQPPPPPPPAPIVSNPAEEVLPPPPQFQEETVDSPPPPLPPPNVPPQPKASAPPTAPKPTGPPPPPPTHKQPPPPVLPKSVPAPNVSSPSHGSPAKTAAAGVSSSPIPAAPRPTVPPPVPPVQASPPTGKVGPPTLPKSSAAAGPACSYSEQGSLKHGQSMSMMSSGQFSASSSSSSAPPTLNKSGTLPANYGSGDGPHQSIPPPVPQASHVSPGSSPHRVSHIKHPSTGSPMLGMGSSPPPSSNQGPTPSDSGYIEGDNSSSCSGSPSNPAYLQELARRHKGPSPGTSPPQPLVQAVDIPSQPAAVSASHRRSASAGSAVVKGAGKAEGGRRAPPPPPPKRNETTRLTTDVPKQMTNTPPASPSTQKNPPSLRQDPIYENCEGMMDINELPPPPPELLAGLPDPSAKSSSTPAGAASPSSSSSSSPQRKGKKQQKLPPPPPKRSKDTQLSQPH